MTETTQTNATGQAADTEPAIVLLPCPFCGEEVSLDIESTHVHCANCSTDGPIFSETYDGDATGMQKQVAFWNGRSDSVTAKIQQVLNDGTLPDGDHPNVPTMLWLESLLGQ